MRRVNHIDNFEIPRPLHMCLLPLDEFFSLDSDEEFIPSALNISVSTFSHLIQCYSDFRVLCTRVFPGVP